MRSTCVQLSPPQSKEKSWEKRIMVGKSGEKRGKAGKLPMASMSV